MRWKCIKCYDFDLCIVCYMVDKYDLGYAFLRIENVLFRGLVDFFIFFKNYIWYGLKFLKF